MTPARWPRGLPALVGLVVAIAALKLALVAAGPELDTDAYGHAVIGRRFLIDPGNIHLHWVWLPLWHVVHAAIAALGSGLGALRYADVALSSASPIVLALTLARKAPADSPLPCAAGALLALSPQGLHLGTSSQPEAFFQLLLLGACLCWEGDRPALTGLVSSVAVLLRYEAWLLPGVWFALWALGLRAPPRSRALPRALAWLWPSLAIAGWVVLHHERTGEWLAFVRINHDYVRDAIARAGYPWGLEPSVWRGLAWYPLTQPYRDYGLWALLTLAGLPWFVRRAPPSHRALAAALLAFLTYGTVAHKHLGLARHYAALTPFYATAMAAGAIAIARAIAPRWSTWLAHRPAAGPSWSTRFTIRPAPAAGLAVALVALAQTRPFARFLFDAHQRAFLPEREAAQALLALAPEGTIVATDLPRVEVYTGLPYRRFIAWGGEVPPPWQGPTGWIIVTGPARAPRDAGLRELFRNDEVVVLGPGASP
ncbi:MAG: hypothetical protein MUF34_06135 [Polyangiaceae bacterium]|jgi:hypothetical protein|nr:hypothetical protein [Polyangiaceae bacterium]